jgi:hypothetical protein
MVAVAGLISPIILFYVHEESELHTFYISTHYALYEIGGCEVITAGCWYIYVGGENGDNVPITIIKILINDTPYHGNSLFWDNVTVISPSGVVTPQSGPNLNIPVLPGQRYLVLLPLDNLGVPLQQKIAFSAGDKINITLVTSSWANYSVQVSLPGP